MASSQIRSHRGLDYAMTINFRKKATHELAEQILEQDLKRQQGQINTASIDYQQYIAPVTETYDTVVHNTLDLLRQVTLEMRQRTTDNASTGKR